MPTTPKSPLLKSVNQGVLVLTFQEAQLQGDHALRALGRELDQAVAAREVQRVVLDFRNVKSLSSAAFRPLLGLRRTLEERGGRLVFCHLAPVVAEAFRATRMLSTSRVSGTSFEVQPTLAAALASLTREPAAPAAGRPPGPGPEPSEE
jgi:anti-anti-sigma factor